MTKSAELVSRCALAKPEAGACSWCAEPLPEGRRMWCRDRCATAFWKNHWWSRARRAAKRRDKYACVRCGGGRPLEVNHITPCLGAHGAISCAHHLVNLETLCVPCHRAHTGSALVVPQRVRADRDRRE
jgi:5-methylcytosine-specific restriction endonuclease McrA